MNKELKVKCPQCKKEFLYYESPFRPFCCERCKQIDLGHWFEESYVVPDKAIIVDTDEMEIENDNEEQNESDYEN